MGRAAVLFVSLSLGLSLFAQSPGEVIRDKALDLVGIREHGCNNCGPEVEFMLELVGFPKGYNWCGAAQYTIMVQAGYRPPGNPRQYAWTPSWFIKERVVWKQGNRSMEDLRIGQQYGLYYPSLGRVAHIGAIVALEGRWIIGVEGNTGALGGRDGGGVERHRRRIDTIWVISQWYQ